VAFLRLHWGSCFHNEETTIFGFGLNTLLIVGLQLDVCSALSGAAIFGWMVLCGIAVGFAHFCYPFAFLTASCDPLTGPDHLFDQFPILWFYLSTVLIWFGSTVGESTPFSIFRSTIFFFHLDQKWVRSFLLSFFFNRININ
jgi:hypothetical protein